MATLISDFGNEGIYKSYGRAALHGNNLLHTRIPYVIIAKGNIFEKVKAEV